MKFLEAYCYDVWSVQDGERVTWDRKSIHLEGLIRGGKPLEYYYYFMFNTTVLY